jgi:hypothetical protein
VARIIFSPVQIGSFLHRKSKPDIHNITDFLSLLDADVHNVFIGCQISKNIFCMLRSTRIRQTGSHGNLSGSREN